MAVVTVSRELGSEGTQIARRVAEGLGYRCVDKGTIEQVLYQYGLLDFRDMYETAPGFWARFDTLRSKTTDMLNRVVKAVARHDNVVIVGRGSYAVLAGFDDVLNVRIQAPFALRVERIAQRQHFTDLDQAAALVAEQDRVRAAFVEFSYGVRWQATSAFDLVIDTGKIGSDLATKWLVEAVGRLAERMPKHAHTVRTLAEDPVLDAAVAGVLDRQAVA